MDPAQPGPIPSHARCIACQYELAGLRPDGLCPECASPIALTLLHLERAAGNEVHLREMLNGLGAIKIAYIIAAINAAFIALAAMLGSGVLGVLALFAAVLSMLLIAGAMISGHVAIATPLPDSEGRTPGFHHGTLIGLGILCLVLGPLVLLRIAIGTQLIIIILLFLAAIAGGPICILLGMGMLTQAIERRTQPSGLLRASRAVAYGASLLIALGLGATATAGLAYSGPTLGLYGYAVATTAIAYPAAHLMLTFALARAIRRSIGDLPPPAPPGAL